MVRSRLLASPYENGERFDLFALISPLKARRMLVQMAAAKVARHPEKKRKLPSLGVHNAH